MAWAYLFIAGLMEVAWAVGMKFSAGFTRPWPSAVTILTMVLSFAFLARSLRELPLSTAYAVWTGIGAVGTALVGIFLFGESREPARVAFILLIVVGLAGLKFATPQ